MTLRRFNVGELPARPPTAKPATEEEDSTFAACRRLAVTAGTRAAEGQRRRRSVPALTACPEAVLAGISLPPGSPTRVVIAQEARAPPWGLLDVPPLKQVGRIS
ncbi:hypothetical protein BHE74_00039648 [Ensete ventricosum]|nr:hypothetical protein BHE74_00039648 [Ensete ventricosum]